MLNKSATDTLQTSPKRVIQEADQATGDLIGNKITGVSNNSQQNNSVIVTNGHDKKNNYINIYISKRKTKNYRHSDI